MKITAKDIKAAKVRFGISTQEAKHYLEMQRGLKIIEEATSVEDIKPVLKLLLLER